MLRTTIPCAEALAHLDAYDAIIDVRSPSEFALDHVPGAINCPVLDDDERARIGMLHKLESAFAAKRAGAALVARNLARHLEERFADDLDYFQADRIHPAQKAQPRMMETVWTQLAPLLSTTQR